MGWLFGWNTRKELVDHLVAGNGVKTLKHCFVGNDMWAVQEYPAKDDSGTIRFVCLYMLRGRGGSRDGWGYKDVDESMGPARISCPVSYIDMCSEPPNDHSRDWRRRVREQHAKAARRFKPGDKFRLYGKQYTVQEPAGRRGYYVLDEEAWRVRMPLSQIKDIEEICNV